MTHSHAVTTYTAAFSYLIFHLKASIVVETIAVIHVVRHLNVRETEIVIRRERNTVSRGRLYQVPVADNEIYRHQQLLNICNVESLLNMCTIIISYNINKKRLDNATIDSVFPIQRGCGGGVEIV